MGGGVVSSEAWGAVVGNTATRSQMDQRSHIHDEMDPKKMKNRTRECVRSAEYPEPFPVVIGFDVTGSMSTLPKDLAFSPHGLQRFFSNIQAISSLKALQLEICVTAFGDSKCDRAPAQMGQFEADNRIGEDLLKLYLEGGGGPADIAESAHLVWYLAAFHTRGDAWDAGKKGAIITIGDEKTHKLLTKEEIIKFIDPEYQGKDWTNEALLAEVRKRFNVFHILVNNDTAKAQGSKQQFVALLGQEHVFEVNTLSAVTISDMLTHDVIPRAAAISICREEDSAASASDPPPPYSLNDSRAAPPAPRAATVLYSGDGLPRPEEEMSMGDMCVLS